jgi:hypothetical protein
MTLVSLVKSSKLYQSRGKKLSSQVVKEKFFHAWNLDTKES